MSIRRTRTKLAVAVTGSAFLGIAAVGEGAAQQTFQLHEVAGQVLPMVVEEEGECHEELVAGTLTLHANGEWTLLTSEKEVCGDRTDVDEERDDGTYSLDGQNLRFLDDDGNAKATDDDDEDGDVEVAEMAVGVLSGGVLMVRLADGTTDLEFRM